MIRSHRRFGALLGSAAAAALAVSTLAAAPASSGTFPGENGLIAFVGKTQDPNDGLNLFTYDLATGATERLTSGPDDKLYAQWSADGSKLSYTDQNRATNELAPTIMNYDGTGVRPIQSPPNSQYLFPVISPNGENLAMIADNQTTNERTLIITDINGGNPRTIATPNLRPDSPQWSPDGGTIVFNGEPIQGNATVQLWTVNADGTGLKQLTPDPEPAVLANWSPDGSQIAYTRSSQNDESWVINADGSNPRPLITDPNFPDTGIPTFSPDGTKLAYSVNGPNGPQLMVQNLDGSDRQTLNPTLNGVALLVAAYPTWQPIPQTELSVQSRPKSKKLNVGNKYKLVKSAETNGTITKVKIVCKIDGDKVKNKAAKNSCNAKEKQKDDSSTAKVVAKPKCDTKVKIKAIVTAQYQEADPLKWKRTWKVKNNTGPGC
jgi:Tol biopolymer transport system component